MRPHDSQDRTIDVRWSRESDRIGAALPRLFICQGSLRNTERYANLDKLPLAETNARSGARDGNQNHRTAKTHESLYTEGLRHLKAIPNNTPEKAATDPLRTTLESEQEVLIAQCDQAKGSD